ncbi:MAG: type II secretion system protein [Kiritimatiellia bacterium]
MKRQQQRIYDGFTLIEVIVTILIMAIALAAIVPLLSQAFLLSHEQPGQLAEAMALHSAMEDLVAFQSGNTLEAFRAIVGPEGSVRNGRFTVVHNRYVGFVGGAETGSPTHNVLLKVTLQNALGERLNRLFAEAP